VHGRCILRTEAEQFFRLLLFGKGKAGVKLSKKHCIVASKANGHEKEEKTNLEKN